MLNLSVLGFSFVFYDKAKRTQQGNMLGCSGVSDYFLKEVLSLMIPKCLVQKERKLEVWIIRKPTMIPPSSMVFVYVIANGLVFVQYLTTCPVLSCLCPVFIHLPRAK